MNFNAIFSVDQFLCHWKSAWLQRREESKAEFHHFTPCYCWEYIHSSISDFKGENKISLFQKEKSKWEGLVGKMFPVNGSWFCNWLPTEAVWIWLSGYLLSYFPRHWNRWDITAVSSPSQGQFPIRGANSDLSTTRSLIKNTLFPLPQSLVIINKSLSRS